jgi:hypothetical protein
LTYTEEAEAPLLSNWAVNQSRLLLEAFEIIRPFSTPVEMQML